MTLVFVLFRYFPFGGMQRNMLAIAEACVERGHHVTVLCHQWRDTLPDSFNVIQLPARGWTNAQRMKTFYQAVQEYRSDHHFDLVVGFNKFPQLDAYYAADSCFAAKAYGDRSFWYRLSPRTRLYLRYEAAVFGRDSNTQILEVSPLEREKFQHYYQTPDRRFHSLPPGIARDRRTQSRDPAARQAVGEEWNIPADSRVLLAIGSGFRTKGLDRTIRLLARWREEKNTPLVLLVAGQDHPARFERLARQLGVADRVIFLGGRDDIPRLLQATDVVVHPAYRENTGNVLLEAMIAGRPVIATANCGYAHYVAEAQMGQVLDPNFEMGDYVVALERVLAEDDKVWLERGRAFAEREEIYSRPQHVAKLLEDFATFDAKQSAGAQN